MDYEPNGCYVNVPSIAGGIINATLTRDGHHSRNKQFLKI